MSSRGKFFHISRWFSSESSAVKVMFKWAQSPLPLQRGFKTWDSTRSFSACAKISRCYSGERVCTASTMDCSRVLIELHFYYAPVCTLTVR